MFQWNPATYSFYRSDVETEKQEHANFHVIRRLAAVRLKLADLKPTDLCAQPESILDTGITDVIFK